LTQSLEPLDMIQAISRPKGLKKLDLMLTHRPLIKVSSSPYAKRVVQCGCGLGAWLGPQEEQDAGTPKNATPLAAKRIYICAASSQGW
jgi:hypothetical protein